MISKKGVTIIDFYASTCESSKTETTKYHTKHRQQPKRKALNFFHSWRYFLVKEYIKKKYLQPKKMITATKRFYRFLQ